MTYVEKLLTTNEQILIRQRMHWIALVNIPIAIFVRSVYLAILAWVIGSIRAGDGAAATYIGKLAGADVLDGLQRFFTFLPRWLLPLLAALYMLSAIWDAIKRFLQWINSLNLVTNRRVIQIHGVLSKTSIDSSLEKVNDVLLSQSLLGRILGYGHLTIMTASETGLNRMSYLPDPVAFKRQLMDSKNVLGDAASGAARSAPPASAGSVAERIGELQKLKDQGIITEEEFAAKRQKLIDGL